MSYRKQNSMRCNRQQTGYSLLELMISTALGLVIMAGVVQMYATSRTAQTAISGTARVQENARYIFNRLERDIGRTSLLGCLPLQASNEYLELDDTADKDTDKIVSLLGYESANGKPFGFFQPAAGLEGGTGNTDQLSLRFMDPVGGPILNSGASSVTSTANTILVDADNPKYSTFKQWQLAILTDCDRAAIFMITNDPTVDTGKIKFELSKTADSGPNKGQYNACDLDGTGAAGCQRLVGFDTATGKSRGFSSYGNVLKVGEPMAAYVYSAAAAGSRVYTVGNSEAGDDAGVACSASNPQYCALKVNDVELVDGVEDFQVQFGEQVGGAANNLAFLDADKVSNWQNVRSIRVSITLNSVDRAGMEGSSDRLYRETFTRTFNMYNMKNSML